MKYLILFLLMLSFVSAVSVNFDCPDSVKIEEEFICSLEVSDGDGVYDVKVYIRGDDGMINRIWNNDDWQRTDWYAKNLISNGESIEVKLKIDKEFYGSATGEFKLRNNGTTNVVFDEDFLIEVLSNEDIEDIEEGDSENIEEEVTENDSIEDVEILEESSQTTKKIDNNVVLTSQKEKIVLNDAVENSEEVVYESKSAKIIDYLPYVFSIFLIFIIGVLVWERF